MEWWLQKKCSLRKVCFLRGIKISEETFDAVASKLQDELESVIRNNVEVNDYLLVMYKYLFISELKVPLQEDLGIQFEEGSFILYIIPDDLSLNLLRKIDDAFDKFSVTFMPNPYNLIKLKFSLCD